MNEMETRLNDGSDLEIAHAEDFGIARDESGELRPIKQRIPGTDKAVLVRPLVDGAYQRYSDVLESNSEVEDDRVNELFGEYIVEGIGSDGLKDVPDYMVSGLVQAIKNSSGYEVFQAVEQQREREQMSRMKAMDLNIDEFVREEMEKRRTENGENADGAETGGPEENEPETPEALRPN